MGPEELHVRSVKEHIEPLMKINAAGIAGDPRRKTANGPSIRQTIPARSASGSKVCLLPDVDLPLTARVMAELGIDISGQRSKDLGEFLDAEMDIGITVCDATATTCPMLHGAKQTVHTRFRDPSGATGTEEERIAVFRAVRDEITAWIDATFGGADHD